MRVLGAGIADAGDQRGGGRTLLHVEHRERVLVRAETQLASAVVGIRPVVVDALRIVDVAVEVDAPQGDRVHRVFV